MLYNLTTGQKPPDNNGHELNFQEVYSPGLKAICEKALSNNSESRYKSVKDLLNDLNLYRRGFATEAERASFARLLKLLYSRNRQLCIVLISALTLVITITAFSFASVNKSKNEALSEKEKVVKANEDNIKLVKQLKFEEQERIKFMKMSAENQLIKLKKMFSQRLYHEIPEVLDFTLKLDPESIDIRHFKGAFEFATLNFEEARKYFLESPPPNALQVIDDINFKNVNSIIRNMPKLRSFMSDDAAFLFTLNCLKRFDEVNEKARLYEWLIRFDHPGMVHHPKVIFEMRDGKRYVSLSRKYAIRNCGPIFLLNPNILDISSTNNLSLIGISKCKELEELNIANTRLVSLKKLNYPNLKKLNISKTVLKNIYPDQFPNLEVLNIAHSSWKQFNRLKGFESLNEIIISKDQLAAVQKHFDNKITVVD